MRKFSCNLFGIFANAYYICSVIKKLNATKIQLYLFVSK